VSKPSREETDQTQKSQGPELAVESAIGKPRSRTPFFVIVAVLALAAALYGYHSWIFAQSHASTDDAQIDGSIINIAPQINGIVSKVFVSENQSIQKGQLLLQLDDSAQQAAVTQAKADLDAAIAAAQAAGLSVNLTKDTGAAQIQQAQGVVDQSQVAITGAQADLAKARAGIRSAQAAQQQASAGVATANAGYQSAVASQSRAAAGVTSASGAVDTANAQLSAAEAQAKVAQANFQLADQDNRRYASLYAQGVISQETAEEKASAAQAAQAALEAAQGNVRAARAQVAQRKADLISAQQTLTAAKAGVSAARAGQRSAQSQTAASEAGVVQAQAAERSTASQVGQARAKRQQAQGQLAQAQTTTDQVALSQSQKTQALAKVEQAKAALQAAQLQLSYTRIYSPVTGRVAKKSVDPGDVVLPGIYLMALVDDSDVWVTANFKETQMPGLIAGCPAEVEVDAVPGRTFTGKVLSVSAGTGSVFTLLPPDNASGNFTKVVQRLPVKISLDPGQPDLDRLRVGMSVTAIVKVK